MLGWRHGAAGDGDDRQGNRETGARTLTGFFLERSMQQQLLFVTRQSPDWHRLASDFKQGRRIDPIRFRPLESLPGFPENIVDLVDLWNAHMPIDFFSCRALLKEVSSDTIAQLPCARRISYDEVGSVGSLAGIENFVVFFHDDDDWFSPNIADIISGISSVEYDVCVFPLVRLWTDSFTFVRSGQESQVIVGRRRDFGFRYQSNNYGLNGRICDRTTLLAMKDHVFASDYAKQRALRDVYIDQIVGVTAKTPCSALMLPLVFSESNKAREHVLRYVDALAALTIPSELSWIAGRIESLVRMFSAVAG